MLLGSWLWFVDSRFSSSTLTRSGFGGGHLRPARWRSLPLIFAIAFAVPRDTCAQSGMPVSDCGRDAVSAWQPEPVQLPQIGSWATDLSELSDQELIDLYVATYNASLRSLVADDAALVDAGRFLVQTGYTFSYLEQNGFRDVTHTIPELLLRYRIWERWELRVAWAGVTWDGLTDDVSGVTDWDTSLSDPSVGARFALSEQQVWLPRASVTISSPLNINSDVGLINRFDPLVGLGYSWSLDNRWLFSGTSALVWTYESGDRYLDYQQSLSMDYLLGRLGHLLRMDEPVSGGARSMACDMRSVPA